MRFLRYLPLVCFVTAIASNEPDASADRDVDVALSKLSGLTDPLLDGLTASLAGVTLPGINPTAEASTEGKATKRQAQDPQQGLSDALNSLLPGISSVLNKGIINQILDLLRDGKNIFTPEWNEKFNDVADQLTPLANDLGLFLGYLIRVILTGSFSGTGTTDTGPTFTQPSFPNNTDSGFQWPDFTIPLGTGDTSSTSTESPAPSATSTGSGSSGLGIDWSGLGGSGSGSDSLGSSSVGTSAPTGTGSVWGNGGYTPSSTTPTGSVFTGVAARVYMDSFLGLGLAGLFGAIVLV